MKYQTVLGIDPGLSNTVWAIVKRNNTGQHAIIAYGCIQTDKKDTEQRRVHQIYCDIREVLQTYVPDLMAVERVFFNQNPTSCLSTAGVCYTCMLAAEQEKITTKVFTPQQVKAACGCGIRAGKEAVKVFVSKLTDTQIKNSHIADATTTAIAGLLKIRTYQENTQ